MAQVGADGCLLTTPVNVYYTCGHIIVGYVYIPLQGDPTFMVRRPNNLTGNHFCQVRKFIWLLCQLTIVSKLSVVM